MIALVFILYALMGAGAGWALHSYAAIELPLAICAGAITTALVGQVHLFASRSGNTDELSNRIDAVLVHNENGVYTRELPIERTGIWVAELTIQRQGIRALLTKDLDVISAPVTP